MSQTKNNLLLSIPQSLGSFLYLILVTVVSALAVYFPLFVALPILILIPVVLVFFKGDAFEKIKLVTLTLGRIVVVLACVHFISPEFIFIAIIWLLRINIFEATMKDLINKRYFNMVTGIALIVSTWAINLGWNGTYYTVLPAAVIFWILAYTIWNWNFVYGQFSRAISLFHVLVLSSPLIFILAVHNPTLWLIARGNSLTFAAITQIGFKQQVTGYFTNKRFEKVTKIVADTRVQAGIMALNLTFIVAFLILTNYL
ncbi:MAG: hypothetical protein WC045_02585 [Patescibacteria group bacterium]